MKRRNKWRVRKVGPDWRVERTASVLIGCWWVVEVFHTHAAAVWLADQRARM